MALYKHEYTIRVQGAALDEIRSYEEQGYRGRISVIRSGCCSMRFEVYRDKMKSNDLEIPAGEVTLICAPSVEPLLMTMTIDYGRDGIFKNFLFKFY